MFLGDSRDLVAEKNNNDGAKCGKRIILSEVEIAWSNRFLFTVVQFEMRYPVPRSLALFRARSGTLARLMVSVDAPTSIEERCVSAKRGKSRGKNNNTDGSNFLPLLSHGRPGDRSLPLRKLARSQFPGFVEAEWSLAHISSEIPYHRSDFLLAVTCDDEARCAAK